MKSPEPNGPRVDIPSWESYMTIEATGQLSLSAVDPVVTRTNVGGTIGRVARICFRGPYTDHVLPGAMIGSSSSISRLKQFVDDSSNRTFPTCTVFIIILPSRAQSN